MKSMGIVKRIDEVGRIVLPKELRKMFDLVESEDSVEIFVDGDQIILKKYLPSCIFCKSTTNLIDFKGQKLCDKCINVLAYTNEGTVAKNPIVKNPVGENPVA
ncbi:MAG TPA: AbrB/MazE/SpoVT family DNA-binding domain-containing protein [Clostridia bacterium]|nr:AbrB/MazE/SpoVT family DNA-binding domain-containing protein [Clostridia bacterium]